ncbi:MAG: hypothetical protein ABEJ69_02510 [Candidatus Nanohaloarchaea archaeon]
MTAREHQRLVNGMAEHYAELMPDRDYQVVGHSIPFNDSSHELGVLRVDFEKRRIYAEDVRENGDIAAEKGRLVAGKFCDLALMELADYSCEAMTSVPLANIEPRDSLDWDFYFQDEETMYSTEAEIFFEEVFGVAEENEDVFEAYAVKSMAP